MGSMATSEFVLFTSSIWGVSGACMETAYSASKAAINSYSMAIRNELHGSGVRVCTVMPGDTKTGFTSGRVTVKNGKSDAYEKKFTRSVKRMERDEQNGISPEHIARAIVRAAESKNPPVSKTVGFQYKLIKFALRLIPERLASFAVRKLYA